MGRGLGPVQKRILELIETTPPKRGVRAGRTPELPDEPGWPIADLAAALDLSEGRTRVAVSGLHKRLLVRCTWDGVSILRHYPDGIPVTAYGIVVWTPAQLQQWRPAEWVELEWSRYTDARNEWWHALSQDERWQRRLGADSKQEVDEWRNDVGVREFLLMSDDVEPDSFCQVPYLPPGYEAEPEPPPGHKGWTDPAVAEISPIRRLMAIFGDVDRRR